MSITNDKELPSSATSHTEPHSEKSLTIPEKEVTVGQHTHEEEEPAKDDELGADLEKHLTRKSTKGSKKKEDFFEAYPLSDLDAGLVGWDSQDDPLNPRNFPHKSKLFILFLVSAITFVSPFCSSILAPGTPFINEDFNNTSELLGTFAVSVFVLGYAVGPLFLSPLSEIYGRCIIMNISNVFFCAFTLGCALAPNLGGLIAMRLLAGVGGSACLTIGTGVIADLFVASQRGRAIALYSLGILFGPILAPICGGFIAQRAGWRWAMWVVFITGVLLTACLFVFNRETNHSVLLTRKTLRLRTELERPDLQNVMNRDKSAAALAPKAILLNGVTRPLRLMATQPILLFCSLYMSFLFGLLYLLFTTLTPVFTSTYGWAPDMTGLAYLGIGIGNFLGIGIVAKTSDATIIKLTKRNGGKYEPEMRLPLCVFFGILIPVSLFWYGWTVYYKVHWIVPIISLVPFGFGLMGIFGALLTYMVDCFPQYAASVTAGMTTLRCLFAGVLPLAGPSMYDVMGYGWGNSMLGFIAVAFIPVPTLLFKYGHVVREKYPIKF